MAYTENKETAYTDAGQNLATVATDRGAAPKAVVRECVCEGVCKSEGMRVSTIDARVKKMLAGILIGLKCKLSLVGLTRPVLHFEFEFVDRVVLYAKALGLVDLAGGQTGPRLPPRVFTELCEVVDPIGGGRRFARPLTMDVIDALRRRRACGSSAAEVFFDR